MCVVGLQIGRRLLKNHGSALQPITIDLKALFSDGFMRQMSGERHRKYREVIVRGITALDADDYLQDLEIIAAGGLDTYSHESGQKESSPQAYLAALTKISSGMLCRVFFGAAPGTERFDRLLEKYHRLGPHGIVWNITERQIENYREVRDDLRMQPLAAADPDRRDFEGSLLGRLTEMNAIDDTLLGNLIYMVEMGRYDLRGLLRWISKYAVENPSWIDRIVSAETNDPEQAHELSRAFVLETLRMDQSERLMRNVRRDFVFDGFTIPKGAIIRVCLWEAHKDNDVFENPFVFEPSRFLTAGQSVDGFSPFGLDHHDCPFSNFSITLGVAFLRTLARGYRIGSVGNGPAVRGVYHWEPPRSFALSAQISRERWLNICVHVVA